MTLAAAPGAKVEATTDPSADRWIHRHRPRNHDLMLGGFAGFIAPSSKLELRERDAPVADFDAAALELGLRVGYYPIRFFGIEGEAAAMPTRYGGDGALLYGVRAQGIVQAGWWRIVPFATLGGGLLGIASRGEVGGVDTDPALHVGGGLKLHATKRLVVRLDVRDVISNAESDGPSHSPEALLSFAVRFGVAPKPKPEPPPADEDGDGVTDADDWCPKVAGAVENKGCPWGDRDCDGFDDNADQCPETAGVAPDGCEPADRDRDGIADPDDECPDVAGLAPSGCPDPDPDRDGIPSDADKCPQKPETVNSFQDADGCPDEIPETIKKFSGVISGITFATNKATIRPSSTPTLEEAARVLAEFPSLKLEISGHTDSRGKRERNLKLSQERADSVKAFLVGKGIDEGRIKTRGAGPDEPRETNDTPDGRAQNRRIEFRLGE